MMLGVNECSTVGLVFGQQVADRTALAPRVRIHCTCPLARGAAVKGATPVTFVSVDATCCCSPEPLRQALA